MRCISTAMKSYVVGSSYQCPRLSGSSVVALLLATVCALNAATITNAGFENGNLTGWVVSAPLYPEYYDQLHDSPKGYTPDGTLTVVEDATHAVEGANYLQIRGKDIYYRLSGTDRHVSVSQTVWMHANEQLSGNAFCDTEDYFTSDTAWVKIRQNGVMIATPWFHQSGEHRSFPMAPFPSSWTQWSFVAPSSGPYQLELGIGNTDDGMCYQVAFFDGLASTTTPDESSVWQMLVIGVAAAWRLGKRIDRKRPR